MDVSLLKAVKNYSLATLRCSYNKKLIKIFLVTLLFNVTTVVNAQSPYCNPDYSNGCSNGDFIRDVFLSNLSNSGSGCSSSQYKLATSDTIVLQQGVNYDLTVASGGGNDNGIGAWIDYSQNQGFGQFGEFIGNVDPVGGVQDKINFTVPPNAGLGITRLRIRSRRSANGVPSPGESCNTYTYGEAEDYVVNIQLAPSCNVPSNVQGFNIGSNSADFDWVSNDNGNSWEVAYGPGGFALGNGTRFITSGKPISIGGLNPDTEYDVYVREICQSGNTSSFSNVLTFRTECAPFSPPYAEDFDSSAIGWAPGQNNDYNTGNTIYTCWSRNSDPVAQNNYQLFHWGPQANGTESFGTGPATDHTTGTANGQFIYAEGDGNGDTASITSPLIDVSSLNTPRAVFWYHMTGFQIGTLIFQVSNDKGATWNTEFSISGQQQNSTTSPWLKQTVNLFSYNNDTINVRFISTNTSSFGGDDIAIDDFVLEETPPCLKPTSLNASNTTTNSADISWTSNDNGVIWEIAYGQKGFNLGNGTRTVTSSNPYTITGLNNNTKYDLYVREICGAGDSSGFSEPVTFRTECGALTAPYKEDFDGVSAPNLPFCWSAGGNRAFDVETVEDEFGTNAPPSPPNEVTLDDNDFSSGEEALLISPKFSGLTNYDKQIQFKAAFDDGNTFNHRLYVGVMGDPNNASTFVVLDTIFSNSDGVFNSYQVDLNNGALIGNKKYVAFAGGSQSSFDDITLDDFSYGSCKFPSNLTASNIDSTSAQIQWNSQDVGSQWEIAYGQVGFTLGNGNRKLTSNKPYNLTGLTKGIYDVYVREICQPGDTSGFEGPLRISTNCTSIAPVDLPYNEGFETFPGVSFKDSAKICNLNSANWKFQSDDLEGRLQFSSSNITTNTGNKAASLDFDNDDFFVPPAANDLILTLNMSNYAVNDSIILSFFNRQYQEDNNPNDQVWIRGSKSDPWIAVYDLFANQPSGSAYDSVAINVSSRLGNFAQSFSATFQVRFGQEGTDPINESFSPDGRSFDDISILINKDLVISQIMNPFQKCGLTANEPVKVAIKNVSSRDLSPTSFEVGYQINNRTEIETITLDSTLAAGDTIVYTFGPTVNLALQGSTNILNTWLNFSSDYNAKNDSLGDTITVPFLPSFPTVNNDTLCRGDTAVLIASGGGADAYNWYTDSVGGTPVATTDTLTFEATQDSTLYVGSITYPDSCESNRIAANVVLKNPDKPSVSENPVCQGDTAILVASGGGAAGYRWYTDSVGGNPISSNDTLRVQANQDSTFYVSGFSLPDTCESSRVAANVVIANPSAPNVGDVVICEGDTAMLVASGPDADGFSWYTDTAGGSPVATDDTFMVKTNQDTTYYVEGFSVPEGCRGPRVAVAITIANPSQPITMGDTVCQGDIAMLSATGGGADNYNWYADSIGGNPIANDDTLSVPINGDSTFYVSGLSQPRGCESPRVATQITTANPAEPLTTGDTVCEGDMAALTVTGVGADDYNWYTQPSGGSPITTDDTLMVQGTQDSTFYVSGLSQPRGCESPRMASTIKLANPSEPTVTEDTICEGGTAVLKASGGNASGYKWYTQPAGGTPVITDNTLMVQANRDSTLYVSGFSTPLGCLSPRVAVNIDVSKPTNLSVTNIGSTSGEVNWSSSKIASDAIVQWGTSGFNLGQGDSAITKNQKFYKISGLEGNKTYDAYIAEICEPGDTGQYAGPVSFTTDSVFDDLAISEIVEPVKSCGLTSQETVTVKIQNKGLNPIPANTSFNIVKQFKNNTPDTQSTTLSGQLAPSDTIVRSFNKPVDLSQEETTNELKVWVNWSGDQRFSNDSLKKPIYVPNVPQSPTVFNDTVCRGNTAKLIAQSNTDNLAWYANATGGNPISNEDTFRIEATTDTAFYVNAFNDPDSCKSPRKRVEVKVNPVPKAGFDSDSSCLNDAVQLVDNSTISSGSVTQYKWNFGDGSTERDSSVNNVYLDTGNYNASLRVTSDNGCKDTVMKNARVHPLPQVDFASDSVCFGDSAKFVSNSDIGTGSIAQYDWDFGDGSTATGTTVSHVYAVTGGYDVSLEVTSNRGCKDTATKPVAVYPKPSADFMSDSACFGDTIRLAATSNISSGSIIQYDWDLGDGSNASDTSVSKVYSDTGNYDISLMVTSDNGCMDTAMKNARVHPLPQVDFASDSACLNDTVQLVDNSSISSGEITGYSWDLDNGTTETGSDISPVYTNSGSYEVSLMVTSDKECMDTNKKIARVHPLPEPVFSVDKCTADEGFNFHNKSPDNSSDSLKSYRWIIDGDTLTKNKPGNVKSQTKPKPQKYQNVTLKATSKFGCTKVSEVDSFQYYPPAEINVNNWDTHVCQNHIKKYELNQTDLDTNYLYEWSTSENVHKKSKDSDTTLLVANWSDDKSDDTLELTITNPLNNAKYTCDRHISKIITKSKGRAPDRSDVTGKRYDVNNTNPQDTGAILICEDKNLNYQWRKTNKNTDSTEKLNSKDYYIAINRDEFDRDTFRYWVQTWKNDEQCKTKSYFNRNNQIPDYLDPDKYVGIEPYLTKKPFKAYPNPVHQKLNIQGIRLGKWQAQVLNMMGGSIDVRVRNQAIIFDRQLPHGMYLLRLSNGKNTLTKKIILSK